MMKQPHDFDEEAARAVVQLVDRLEALITHEKGRVVQALYLTHRQAMPVVTRLVELVEGAGGRDESN